MKTVISASRRTDIPAFYLPWFMEKIQQGFVDVPNPFNRNQIRRVSLSPKDVAWIVFWSRNYHVFLKNYDFFDYYNLFFHFTITPPDRLLEPDMISPDEAFRQLEKLVERYGPQMVVWRYDPLVFYRKGGELTTNHDIRIFRRYLRTVSSLDIHRCYISVAFLYKKLIQRVAAIPNFEFVEPKKSQKLEILQEMADLASLYGIQLYSCSNDALLKVHGMRKGQCIDGGLLNRLGPHRVSEKMEPTRPDCGCTASIDIGDYIETACRYRCLYCYARE